MFPLSFFGVNKDFTTYQVRVISLIFPGYFAVDFFPLIQTGYFLFSLLFSRYIFEIFCVYGSVLKTETEDRADDRSFSGFKRWLRVTGILSCLVQIEGKAFPCNAYVVDNSDTISLSVWIFYVRMAPT